jgi:hypothetical protein
MVYIYQGEVSMSDNFWRKIVMYYCNKGISTNQFFGDNPTEIGRDAMLFDFSERALVEIQSLKVQLKREMACVDFYTENNKWCIEHYDVDCNGIGGLLARETVKARTNEKEKLFNKQD